MAIVQQLRNGDGSTLTGFTFTFPSIKKEDIKVSILTTSPDVWTDTTNFTVANYTSTGGGEVQFTAGNAPASGSNNVRIYRDTDVDTSKATYQAGSSIRALDLNSNKDQDIYALQELKDGGINTASLLDGAVTREKIRGDAVNGDKIADDSINSEHIVDGSVDLAHLSANSVDSSKIVDGSIVNADVNASAAIEFTKLENLDSGRILVGNGSNKATETVMSGDVAIDNAGATTIQANAVQIGNISDTETTLTANSDAKIPTSKAVADHVVDVVNSVGGFVIVADKDNFPASHPDPNNDAGTVLSITNPNGLTVSSNTSSNGTRTGGSSTVTINNIPTSAGSTLTANYTMLVQTTSTEHTYDFYKFLAKDGDVLNLSNDINDFAARYRVNAGEPSSDNDEGDLVYDTNANKMKVYDGSSWGEVTSTGDFKFLALTVAGTANAAVYGSATSFDLKEGAISGAAASVTSAAQLLVSVNGVIQKPNSGTSQPAEGFAMADSDTIIFGSAPPSGSTVFAIQIGAATDLQVPADNTVTAAKLDLSIVQGDLIYGTGTDTWAKLAKGTAGQVLKMNSGASAPEWGTDNNDTLTEEQVEDFVGGMVTGNTETGITVTYEDSDGTLDFVVDDTTKMPLAGGTFTGDVTFDNQSNAGRDIVWDESDDSLNLKDNVKLKLGDSGDLAIYHDGSNSYLAHESGTGDLILNSDSTISLNPNGGGEYGLRVHTNGACELYYDNTKELETKSGGVKLLGHSEQFVTALTPGATVTIDFSVGNHFSITLDQNTRFNNPTTENVGQSGTITITQPGSGGPYTGSWGTSGQTSQFLWAGGGTPPTLSTAANAVDRIDYVVVAADKIHCVASLDMKVNS